MGVIAQAGLIGGIGKGISEAADVAIKRDFAALEEAKEIRLRQLDAQQRMSEQATQIQASKDLQTQQQQGNKELQESREIGDAQRLRTQLDAQGEQSEKDRAARAAEGKADRTSAEKIADTRMKSNIGRGFKPDKFTTSTVKASKIDAEGNISEIETLAVTRGGQTFVQLGKNFVPYEAGKPAKEPRFKNKKAVVEAERRITRKNASVFLREYGYVPADFIKYIAQGDSPFGNDEATEEEE